MIGKYFVVNSCNAIFTKRVTNLKRKIIGFNLITCFLIIKIGGLESKLTEMKKIYIIKLRFLKNQKKNRANEHSEKKKKKPSNLFVSFFQ